jgi:hypothetical protein
MMRYLLGPVGTPWRNQNLPQAHQTGQCLTFGPADADIVVQPADTWESLAGRFPAGWQPDAVVLYLAYASIPPCLWAAPVPLLGLAMDWPNEPFLNGCLECPMRQ